MNTELPLLIYEDFSPTRNYLQDVAKVLGSLQRAFLPSNEHDWQHGLEVSMRGISTQRFTVAGEEMRALLDLVKFKVRFGHNNWLLNEYGAPELFNNVKAALANLGLIVDLEEPEFGKGVRWFDVRQAALYAEALWWVDVQFRSLKATLVQGETSPILLFPHHFDMALTWFPENNEKQFTLGFSPGDDVVIEPYLYLTAYPKPSGFTDIDLPRGAYWQKSGFSGAVLPYAALQTDDHPAELLSAFATITLEKANSLAR